MARNDRITTIFWNDSKPGVVFLFREVRYIGGCRHHVERVGGRGAHLIAVQRPVHEIIARGRGGRQRAARPVFEGTRSGHLAAHRRVGVGRYVVGAQLEVGDELDLSTFSIVEEVVQNGFVHLECELGIRRQHHSGRIRVVCSPVDELVTCCRYGLDDDLIAVIDGAIRGMACNDRITTIYWNDGKPRIILLFREVRHIGGCRRHVKRVGGRSRDLLAVQCPVHEIIARGRSSRQCAAFPVFERTRSGHFAAHRRVRIGRNDVGTLLEVGDKFDLDAIAIVNEIAQKFLIHQEGKGIVGGQVHDGVVSFGSHVGSGPFDKFIAVFRCGFDGNLIAVIDGAIRVMARDVRKTAIFGNVSKPGVILLFRKVRYILNGIQNIKINALKVINHFTVPCPVHKVVTRSRACC